jgi:ribosomal protein S18 acetylase RimI-like enzyme
MHRVGGVRAEMIVRREVGGIQYGTCESSDVGEMVSLLGEVFSLYDPPVVAVGLTAAEFEAFVRLFGGQAGVDRLTIIARSGDTGEMIGALLTEDSVSPSPRGLDQLSRKFDPISDILDQLDVDYRRGKTPRPGDSLHLFLLGVARSFGGRGVAQQLVATCLQNGLHRGYRIAVTEATNRVSQHIFRKSGFTDRVRRSYRDYRFEGKAVFASIEEHTGPVLMDKTLASSLRLSGRGEHL